MESTREISFNEVTNEAYVDELRRDENVFLPGISIQAGTFPHTTDLYDEFGTSRIVDTPLAETGMIGCALGAAQGIIDSSVHL
jgi:pyruvate/2-oxoglutarate/acetoin dehydrogenase E1 component